MGSPAAETSAGPGTISPDGTWPTSTREHIDLWLHGYALLTADTARVPFFRRGYRQRMRALRSTRSVYTQLDANADKLSSGFLANPSLVNGQFLPFYFSSFQQMQQATHRRCCSTKPRSPASRGLRVISRPPRCIQGNRAT